MGKKQFLYQNKKLSYSILGDVNGFPIFINYGLLGSVELSRELVDMAKVKHLKLIVLERAGYGNSDFIEMQNYMDWSKITEQFLDYLGVTNFAVIGISAGAPYAYAMTNYFKERVVATHIISGVPYIIDNDVFVQYKNKDFYNKIWNFSQKELQKEMYDLLKKYNNFFYNLILPKSIKNWVKLALMNNCSGIAQSVRLQMKDWGFDIYQLEQKIYYWHGSKDKEVPINAVKVMTEKMKNAEFYEQKGKGHEPDKKLTEQVLDMINEECREF